MTAPVRLRQSDLARLIRECRKHGIPWLLLNGGQVAIPLDADALPPLPSGDGEEDECDSIFGGRST